MLTFPKYESYQSTEIEWLGEIPEHWGLKKNKFLLVEKKNTVGKNSSDFTLLSLTLQGIIARDMENPQGKFPAEFNTYKVVEPNDLVFCLFDVEETPRTVGHAKQKGMITGAYDVFECNYEIDSRYLYYYYLSLDFDKRLKPLYSGLRKVIKIDAFLSTKSPVPPIEEQNRIVEFLDRKTSEIDQAIAQKQRLIELLQEQKAILINQAVTKGLNPNVSMRDSGIEWIGEIPSHWKTMMIKRIARSGHKTFIDGDWIEAPYITDEGIRLIQTGNVGIGEYIEKGFRYISEPTFSKLNCTEVLPNDVLICRLDGPVGRACLAPNLGVRMITSVDNAILKPSEEFDARFIVYSMSSDPWLDWIRSLCRVGGGFRFRISRSMLGELRITAPPIEEQREIADRLDKKLNEVSILANELLRGIEALNEYRRILTANAVTGKIKV